MLVLEGSKDFRLSRLTNFVSEPVLTNIIGIPYIFWKIGRTFIDINELDKFGVKMWVVEGAVGHQGIVEMLRVVWVIFECRKSC